jgi:hypothetical protein
MFALLTALALTVPGEAPEINYFWATCTPGDTLWVDGSVVDEDFTTVTVDITWLGQTYQVTLDDYGYFFWYTDIEEGDEGWISAVAHDSEGLDSEPVEDLVLPY